MRKIIEFAIGSRGPTVCWLVFLLCMSSKAGEISGKIEISRALTKRRVTVPSYQARGPAVSSKPSGATISNESQRVAIYLAPANAVSIQQEVPQRLELAQSSQRFSSELVIVPTGSTISFPNHD